MSAPKTKTCPHGVDEPFNSFVHEPGVPRSMHTRTVAILDSRDCPSCLRERVRRLRLALDTMTSLGVQFWATATSEQRELLHAATEALYDDVRRWGP